MLRLRLGLAGLLFFFVTFLVIPAAQAQVGGLGGASTTDAPYDAGVKALLDRGGLIYEIDDDGDFKMVYEVGDGRTQLVYVRSQTEEYDGLVIREVWAPAYKAEADQLPADVANLLLESSFNSKMGAWVKMNRMAIFVVKLDGGADLETLEKAISFAVEKADQMEEQLTGEADAY